MDGDRKGHAIETLNTQTGEMRRQIHLWEQEEASIEVIPGMEQKRIDAERDIAILKQKGSEMNDLMDALSLRRDGLKAKLEEFRINHPVSE